jgi:dTMP kinase
MGLAGLSLPAHAQEASAPLNALFESYFDQTLVRNPERATGLGDKRGQDRWNDATEALLFAAARADHVAKLIRPALARGDWVVCDRFTDATFAYQGGGRELGVERIAVLERWVHPALQPDCTWLFDVPLAVARERLDRTREQDRFEQEAAAFFERTRAVYLARAQQEPLRIQRVDATQTVDQIRQQIVLQLEQLVTERRLT